MKEICYKSIQLSNFQMFEDQYIEFDKDMTLLSGFNGVGKTTVLSAILWCLTGNDYYNRNKFDIKPYDNGVRKDEMNTYVCMEMLVDGEPFKIAKMQKNGKNTARINDMAINNQKEYESYISNKLGVSIEQIRLLSNPNHVANLSWQELRKLITGLVPNVEDKDIASLDEFKPIRSKVEEFGIKIFADSVISQTKELKSNLIPNILGRIEQQDLLVKELGTISSNIKSLVDKKTMLEDKIDNYKARINKEIEKQNLVVKEKEKLSQLKYAYDSAYQTLREIENEGKNLKFRIDSLVDSKQLRRNATNEVNNKMKAKDFELKAENSKLEYLKQVLNNANSSLEAHMKPVSNVCELCGQILPKDKMALYERENALKIEEAKKVVDKAQKEVDKQIKKIKKIEQDIEDLKVEFKAVKTKDFSNEYENNPEVKKLSNERIKVAEDYKKQVLVLKMRKKDYDVQLKVVQELPDIDHIESPNELISELQEVTSQIDKARNIKREKEKLDALQKEYDDLCKKLNNYSILKDMCYKFISIKGERTKETLKKYFKITEFVTSELQKNGEEKECFKLSLDGRTYEMLSTGEKVRVGIDLVLGLQKLLDIKMPILIDQLGEISKLNENIKQQVIGCKTMQELNAKEKEKDKEMYNKYMSAYSKLNVTKG